MGTILNRRRAMGEEMSDIDILKSMGCLMWFPLTENNSDLMNSGASCNISIYRNGWAALTFNYGTSKGFSDVMFSESDFANGNYTLFITANKESSNGQKLSINAKVTSTIYIGGAYDIYGSDNVGSFETYHTGITVRIKNGNIRKRYSDGILVDETEYALPDIWDYDYLRFVSNVNNSSYYVRNFLLFNKALSSDEITTVLSIIEK